jgi:hypothetical protein
MLSETGVATLTCVMLTASLGFYLYGSWLIITTNPVTWRILRHHLVVISIGLVLTTAPLLGWMLPRLLARFGGILTGHAFLGFQAYAFLLFAVSGIVPIIRAKRRHELYSSSSSDVLLDELHENIRTWRLRLRVGIVGYLSFWTLSYLLGVVYYLNRYLVWRL